MPPQPLVKEKERARGAACCCTSINSCSCFGDAMARKHARASAHCTYLRPPRSALGTMECRVDLSKRALHRVAPTSFAQLALVQHLNLAYNQLRCVDGIEQCTQLRELSLYFNGVGRVAELARLRACAQLSHLDCRLNPITTTPHYRRTVVALLPSLHTLDTRAITEAEREMTPEVRALVDDACAAAGALCARASEGGDVGVVSLDLDSSAWTEVHGSIECADGGARVPFSLHVVTSMSLDSSPATGRTPAAQVVASLMQPNSVVNDAPANCSSMSSAGAGAADVVMSAATHAAAHTSTLVASPTSASPHPPSSHAFSGALGADSVATSTLLPGVAAYALPSGIAYLPATPLSLEALVQQLPAATSTHSAMITTGAAPPTSLLMPSAHAADAWLQRSLLPAGGGTHPGRHVPSPGELLSRLSQHTTRRASALDAHSWSYSWSGGTASTVSASSDARSCASAASAPAVIPCRFVSPVHTSMLFDARCSGEDESNRLLRVSGAQQGSAQIGGVPAQSTMRGEDCSPLPEWRRTTPSAVPHSRSTQSASSHADAECTKRAQHEPVAGCARTHTPLHRGASTLPKTSLMSATLSRSDVDGGTSTPQCNVRAASNSGCTLELSSAPPTPLRAHSALPSPATDVDMLRQEAAHRLTEAASMIRNGVRTPEAVTSHRQAVAASYHVPGPSTTRSRRTEDDDRSPLNTSAHSVRSSSSASRAAKKVARTGDESVSRGATSVSECATPSHAHMYNPRASAPALGKGAANEGSTSTVKATPKPRASLMTLPSRRSRLQSAVAQSARSVAGKGAPADRSDAQTGAWTVRTMVAWPGGSDTSDPQPRSGGAATMSSAEHCIAEDVHARASRLQLTSIPGVRSAVALRFQGGTHKAGSLRFAATGWEAGTRDEEAHDSSRLHRVLSRTCDDVHSARHSDHSTPKGSGGGGGACSGVAAFSGDSSGCSGSERLSKTHASTDATDEPAIDTKWQAMASVQFETVSLLRDAYTRLWASYDASRLQVAALEAALTQARETHAASMHALTCQLEAAKLEAASAAADVAAYKTLLEQTEAECAQLRVELEDTKQATRAAAEERLTELQTWRSAFEELKSQLGIFVHSVEDTHASSNGEAVPVEWQTKEEFERGSQVNQQTPLRADNGSHHKTKPCVAVVAELL